VKRLTWNEHPTIRPLALAFSTTAELRSEVAGSRIRTWHLMPTERMGPPPGASSPMRMTASWSGSTILPHTSLSVARSMPHLASSPRILTDRQTGTDQTSLSPFIVAPRAQVSRRCETQAPLGDQAAKLCYRFGPLTPSARSANLIAGDGTKNGFPALNKEPNNNPKTT
jgi:hypothetical protein